MNLDRLFASNRGGQYEDVEYDPREEARLGRREIQASAWALIEKETALKERAKNARFSVVARALGRPTLAQNWGWDTESPLAKAERETLSELSHLRNEKLASVKDFYLTLKILVPQDPYFRGVETCEDPISRLVDRAREWIVPVPQDAAQLDRDLENN